MILSPSWRIARFLPALLILNGCSSSDRPTAPRSRPEFAISDAVHEAGTRGFYFLPPMVAQPTFSGTFDADIATLHPAIAICDVTNDANCGTSTTTLIVFTTSSTPAITVDLTTPQYQVNWNTQAAGFVAGHTYRVHVTAGASGARRELGFADVLLTTTPGQAKFLQTGDIIVLQDGRTLPIHVRIETGIPGSLTVSAASASVAQGGTDLITATVRDLHSAALAGATVAWSVTTTPATGVADATQPLTPTSGTTGTTGTTSTTFKAGATSGTAVLAAANAGLSAATSVTVACNCWITKSPMPTPRGQLGVAVINGILYAVGGYNGGPLSTVEAYDPTTDTWTTKASMPTARSGFAVGVINGILYAAAGTQGGSLKDVVEAYDPTTDTWTTKTRAPTARFGVGGGVVNGILYVVGGDGFGGLVPTVEAYDPSTDTWTEKASMPTPRSQVGVGVANGILYAVGGSSVGNALVPLSVVEAYDPATDTWTTKTSLPVASAGPGVGVVNGILYAVGGFSGGSTNQAYDSNADTWTMKASMPTSRYLLGVGVANGILFAVGGGDPPGVSTLEAYQP